MINETVEESTVSCILEIESNATIVIKNSQNKYLQQKMVMI